jgi:hypothetical protein
MKLLLCTLCAIGFGSLGVHAQTGADFSGTWTMDLSRSDAAAQGTPIGPVTIVIRQGPDDVRIDTTQNGITQTVTYLPEGTKQVVDDDTAGTFRWEGPQLVTNLVTHINKQAVTVAEARKLNAAGTEMTVAVTLVVQHGYSGTTIAPGAKNPPNTATGTNVFLRSR